MGSDAVISTTSCTCEVLEPNAVMSNYRIIYVHSKIGTSLHHLVHHGPNAGEIVLKFAVYIVYNICNRKIGARDAVISTASCTRGSLGANVVMSNHRV